MLRRCTCARCHGAREPARPAHADNSWLTARALENRHAESTSSSEGETPSRVRKRWERFFDATSEEVLGCAACFESKGSWLTFEFTRGRKRAKPAVGRRVQRRVRPQHS